MKFELNKEQMRKYRKWQSKKGDMINLVGCAGGAYSFCFTMTGIGTIVEAKCVDGTSIDLTDWENF